MTFPDSLAAKIWIRCMQVLASWVHLRESHKLEESNAITWLDMVTHISMGQAEAG